VSLQAVKELLGHSSIAKTMRYAHLSPAHLREAVGKLESGISGTTWAQGFVTEVAF
jgi:integrase